MYYKVYWCVLYKAKKAHGGDISEIKTSKKRIWWDYIEREKRQTVHIDDKTRD